MSSKTPVPKVQAAGAGGAIATVLVIVANAVGLDLPPEVASGLVAVAAFAAGYLKRDKVTTLEHLQPGEIA
jgi:hypothetical protein